MYTVVSLFDCVWRVIECASTERFYYGQNKNKCVIYLQDRFY